MECPYDGYLVLMGFGGYTVVSFCVPRRTYMERRPARAYSNVRARALGPTGVYTQITCSVPTVVRTVVTLLPSRTFPPSSPPLTPSPSSLHLYLRNPLSPNHSKTKTRAIQSHAKPSATDEATSPL